jgi:hypothetical protein
MMAINNFIERKIFQVPGNIVSDMGGEKVMLSVEKGKYYNLGEVGGVIWELIEKKVSITQIVDELVSNYEVKREECAVQVTSFLEHLLDEGLIKIVE